MSLGKPVVQIANRLFEYSNLFVEIRCDVGLPIPGLSLIEQDIHGLFRPIIVLNPTLIPEDENVIAHIISHEWGHHVLRHIERFPSRESSESIQIRQQKENEADCYAAKFVKQFRYDLDSIIAFFEEHPIDIENRITILRGAPAAPPVEDNSRSL